MRHIHVIIVCLSSLFARAAVGGTAEREIKGTVTDNISGSGVYRALVRSGDNRLATLTDRDGAFSFKLNLSQPGLQEVSPGSGGILDSFVISVEKPGYLSPVQQIVRIDAAEDKPDILEFRVEPESVISGVLVVPKPLDSLRERA